MKNIKTSDICYIALFTAILCVCGWIYIPVGALKYTLQTLGVLLCGAFLGWKKGFISVFAYVLLGAVGVPVFAGFSAGLFSSPTGGYIVGFLLTVILVGIGYQIEVKNLNERVAYFLNLLIRTAFMVIGLLVCYACAVVWFTIYQAVGGSPISVGAALSTLFFPYFWFDGIKIILALLLVDRLKRFIK